MESSLAVCLIVFFIIILFLIWRPYRTEHFTALSGIESPLTTYDDYGTFDFIFHFDDLPIYDPTYWAESCAWEDYPPQLAQEEMGWGNWIPFDGPHKVRRELIGSNYSNNPNQFDVNRPAPLLVKKDRPQAPLNAPLPANIY